MSGDIIAHRLRMTKYCSTTSSGRGVCIFKLCMPNDNFTCATALSYVSKAVSRQVWAANEECAGGGI